MSDIDYKKWADYIESIFLKYEISPRLIADLGCGTGSFCIEMAQRGYDMIGIDRSIEMLSEAKSKAVENKADILLLNQDIKEFELYGTVDAITCLMDTINHITSPEHVRKMFILIANYLNPGGIFIFDINTNYKFESILADNVFYEIEEEIAYIWQNKYSKNTKLCRFDLTFFIKEKSFYRRYDESFVERAYDVRELEKAAIESGLRLEGVFEQFCFRAPVDKSDRVFLIFRK